MRLSLANKLPLLHSLLLLALSMLPSCVPPADDEASAGPVTLFWAEDESLRFTLSAAIDRLHEATGRYDIMLDADGIPVEFVDAPTDAGGEPACGITLKDANNVPRSVEVMRVPTPGRCRSVGGTLMHELFHALSPFAQHSAEGTLFALHSNNISRIDDVSLARLCEGFDCTEFVPEIHLSGP